MTTDYRCSFCGAVLSEAQHLFAGREPIAKDRGPQRAVQFFVCNTCVLDAGALRETGAMDKGGHAKRCSFCDKPAGSGGVLHAGALADEPGCPPCIDDECLALCREIIEIEPYAVRSPGVHL